MPRRWVTAAAWAAGAVAVFLANLRLSQTNATNSDGSSQALQAWDMLHGNLLLHGWLTTDVSFYTTEIPEYMLAELAGGLNANVVHISAALTYTLAMLLAALLALGSPRAGLSGRERAARGLIAAGIMLAPQLQAGTYTLLNSPDHIGTSVPVLLVWLIVDRAPARWFTPVVTSVILAWAEVADVTVFYIGVLPLAAVCAYRVLRARISQRRPLRASAYEISLAAGALAAGVIGFGVPHLIVALGGFHSLPAGTQLSPPGVIARRNIPVAAQGLLLLAGADFLGLGMGVSKVLAAAHLAGLLLGAVAAGCALGRLWRERDITVQVLGVAIAVNLLAYVAGIHSRELSYTREIAPVLPFAAALAGRLLGGPVASMPGRRGIASGHRGIVSRSRSAAARAAVPALLAVLAGYLAGFAFEISQPVMPAQNAALATWLAGHHLRYGLAGYWQSSVITLTTGGRVEVRPLDRYGQWVYATERLADASWYDPGSHYANFVVSFKGNRGDEPFTAFTGQPAFSAMTEAARVFGPPARTYAFGRYTIAVWNRNLLTDLPRRPLTLPPSAPY